MLKKINIHDFFCGLSREFTGIHGHLPWRKISALLAEMESGAIVERWTIKFFLEWMKGYPSTVVIKITPRAIGLRWVTGSGHSVKAVFRVPVELDQPRHNLPSKFFLSHLKLGEENSREFYPLIKGLFLES